MTKKTIIIIAGVVLAGLACWYLFGYVSDQRARTDAIRDQLDAVSNSQQSVIDRLGKLENGLADSQKQVERISGTVGAAAGAVNSAQERIEQSQERVRTSAEILADCQRILREVRARGQSGEN